MKQSKELFSIILLAVLILSIQYKGLFSDYILEEERKTAEVKKPEADKLSRYVARNIRAEVIQDKSSIRISWDLHRDSDDDYIVGRSLSVPDTMEKALKSFSIKVVPAGAKSEVIDSDLKPGAYYYCVLAKSKIIDREIKLYADQNYTVNPAVIGELKREPEKILPPQVSLIYARIVNNNQIRITWRGVESRGIIYTVYRGNVSLDSPAKLSQAEKIREITDGRESYIDDINKSGTYFYAVTAKDASGNEDLNLVADQSCTLYGIFISLELPAPVDNISARIADEGVKISWDKTSTGVSEYLIYRSRRIISDQQKINSSTLLERVPEKESSFIDKNPPDGNHYYAVLTKFLNGKVLNDLIKGENYTIEPVVLGSPIRLLSFTGLANGTNIELTWKTTGNLGNKNYKIMRKSGRIKTMDDLEEADVAAYVSINDSAFTDQNLNQGRYYYAIIPESVKDKEYDLKDSINVIEKGIVVSNTTVPEIPVPGKKTKTVAAEKKEDSIAGIDIIIQKYFLTGKYEYALSELRNFISDAHDKHEAAKAKLFIGRSLIELKKYKDAVPYFILKDVNDYYPREAEFWRDFAILRIPDDKNHTK